MQPFPIPSDADATHKIGSRLAKFESVDDNGPLVY